ncbi:futalosine hydrolase [Paenibacillus sp.]|uniref:futalosine hydrolase n=1 Tax=Paenibacillus sp. TaxID=58172 RepID=UPI002811E2D7|nr:futalosine hydrolase [Paenibacillus sp.]
MNEPTASQGRILIVTAVDAERDAVLRGIGDDPRFVVAAAGVGPAFAAAGAAFALAEGGYALAISAGIGGGFAGRAGVGELVVADAIHAADLGAETPEGFRDVEALGFGSARFAVEAKLAARWAEALREAGRAAAVGPIATVSTTTGTAVTAAALAARIPGVAAEAMEGAGVAAAAYKAGVPALEIRAISNAVGPRDRAAWRIGDALAALEAAFALFPEVLRNR